MQSNAKVLPEYSYTFQVLPKLSINSFVSNTPFLYPLKTSENRKVF